MKYEFHPAAESEHLEIVAYYESKMAGLGATYLTEFQATISRILQDPTSYQIAKAPSIRKANLRQFPFAIIYRSLVGRVLCRKELILVKFILALLFLYSSVVFASTKCDESGEGHLKVEIDSSLYLVKPNPDPDPKYKDSLITPKLYCDKPSTGVHCAKWYDRKQYADLKVAPRSVVCSYERRTLELKNGVRKSFGKFVIYVES